MQIRCPHCGAAFDTSRSGLQFCFNCGRQIEVPESAATGPAPSGVPSSGPVSPAPGTGAPTPSGYGPPGAGSFASPPTVPPAGPAGPPPGAGFGSPPGGAFGGPPGDGSGAPPSGPGEPPGGREDTPWERRKELGFFNALGETWRRTMFSPHAFWSSVKPNGDWLDALLYAWLIAAITLLLQLPFQALKAEQSKRMFEWFAAMKDLPPEVSRSFETMSGLMAGSGFLLGASISTILLYPLGLFIFTGIVHLFCMLFGCAGNTYWATFRALCYATAPSVIAILSPLPCVGVLFSIVSLVYFFALAIWGVYRLQDTTPGKAAAAVLAPLVLLCCCCSGLTALTWGAIRSALMGGGN